MLCMVMFRSAIADWNVGPTGSMQPTIKIGDRILVDRMTYDIRLPLTHITLLHLADPQRGDIVVVDSKAAHERLVKRVLGLPGDRIAMRDNVLFINGHAARYDTTAHSGIRDDRQDPARYEIERHGRLRHTIRLSVNRPSPASNFGPVIVPTGQYLLLGDDRETAWTHATSASSHAARSSDARATWWRCSIRATTTCREVTASVRRSTENPAAGHFGSLMERDPPSHSARAAR